MQSSALALPYVSAGALLLHDVEPDEAMALLIALVQACGLAKEVFSGEGVDFAEEKLQTYAEQSQIAKAVRDDVTAATVTMVTTQKGSATGPLIDR